MKRVLIVMPLLCACVRTPVEPPVATTPLPQAFPVGASGPSMGEQPWRTYFAEPYLVELIDEALARNLDLATAVQRVEIARAGVKAATGVLLPQIALGAGAGLRKFGRYTMDGAGNASTEIRQGQIVPVALPDYSIGLVAAWEVDLWGRLRNLRKSAIAQYLASIDGANAVVCSLIAEVATGYYELLALDATYDVLERTIAKQEHALEVVRIQRAAGRSTELAVQQFEAQVASTRALLRQAQQGRVEAENRLNLLLGRFPQPVPREPASLLARSDDIVSTGVPSSLLTSRPDVREAERELEATKFDVAAARAAFLPSLTITAGAGYQAFNPRFLFTTPESIAYNITGGLLAPLVNRAALQATFSAASATQIQAMYRYQQRILDAFADVVNGLASIENARAALAWRTSQKDALVRSVETADVLYQAAKAGYLEVLLAQQATLQADLALLEAHRAERIARVAVYKALGGGWR